MSRAILTGPRSQRISQGPTRLEIASVQGNVDVTVTGNVFSLTDVGEYHISLEMFLDAIGHVRNYTVDLYNETTAAVIQSFKADAEPTGIGDFQSFLFYLNSANAAHQYSLRINPNGSGTTDQRMNVGSTRTLVSPFAVSPGVAVLATLSSDEIDFKTAPADAQIAIPAGFTFRIDEIDLIGTDITNVVTQPTVRAGIVGTLEKYLTAQQTTLLDASNKRERFTALNVDEAESSASNLTVGWTVAAAADTFKGRFVVRGLRAQA